jgi:hypothetical protein
LKVTVTAVAKFHNISVAKANEPRLSGYTPNLRDSRDLAEIAAARRKAQLIIITTK